MNQLPEQCPLCNGPILVTRLYCVHCDVTLEGHFQTNAGPFARLSPEQTQFMLAFVRNEGRFNRLEEELNLSYPTLRNRLHEVIRALGFEPGREEPPPRLTPQERMAILEELAQGRIGYDEAQLRLRGKRDESEKPAKE
jgi:hypothetical protein